jgi:hypothetical protein
VPTSPKWRVTLASADNTVMGSKRFRKWGMDFSLIYKPSATNKKSSFPSSAFNAVS